MNEQLTLTGDVHYNTSYPPKDAKKGYIARIAGREPGALKFNREFLGREVSLVEGDEGFYERQVGEKKGGYTRYYNVVLHHPEHGMIRSVDCEDIATSIATRLDKGHAIEDIIAVNDLRTTKRVEGLMVFDATVLPVATVVKNKRVEAVEHTVATCLAALSTLSELDKKKAIVELRKRVKSAV